MQSFKQIQFQIGAWALKNFGQNTTPILSVDRVTGATNLGSLAPLMGIMEELGEMIAAIEKGEAGRADEEDAIGDIAIYLCDYCCRENIAFPERVVLSEGAKLAPAAGVVVYLGDLYRCHLKRFQGIRGMENKDVFDQKRHAALRGFVWHLEAHAKTPGKTNLVAMLNKTWNDIVSKRDWKADAAKGGDHSHEGASDD